MRRSGARRMVDDEVVRFSRLLWDERSYDTRETDMLFIREAVSRYMC